MIYAPKSSFVHFKHLLNICFMYIYHIITIIISKEGQFSCQLNCQHFYEKPQNKTFELFIAGHHGHLQGWNFNEKPAAISQDKILHECIPLIEVWNLYYKANRYLNIKTFLIGSTRDRCSILFHPRPELIWLVGCLGFSGPFRQYSSLYRAVFQREGE